MKSVLSMLAGLVTVVTLLGAGQAAGVVDVDLPVLTEGRVGTPDVIGQPVLPYREAEPDVIGQPVAPGQPVQEGVDVAPTGPKGTESERTEPMVGAPVQRVLMPDDDAGRWCQARVEVALHYEPVHGSVTGYAVPGGTWLELDGPQWNAEWRFVVVNGVQGWVWGLDCR